MRATVSTDPLLSGRLPKTPSSAKIIARGEKVTLAGRGARDGTPLTGPVLVRVVLGEEIAA